MEPEELAREMLNFLNETGNYNNFIDWAVARGFDGEALENDMTTLEES